MMPLGLLSTIFFEPCVSHTAPPRKAYINIYTIKQDSSHKANLIPVSALLRDSKCVAEALGAGHDPLGADQSTAALGDPVVVPRVQDPHQPGMLVLPRGRHGPASWNRGPGGGCDAAVNWKESG